MSLSRAMDADRKSMARQDDAQKCPLLLELLRTSSQDPTTLRELLYNYSEFLFMIHLQNQMTVSQIMTLSSRLSGYFHGLPQNEKYRHLWGALWEEVENLIPEGALNQSGTATIVHYDVLQISIRSYQKFLFDELLKTEYFSLLQELVVSLGKNIIKSSDILEQLAARCSPTNAYLKDLHPLLEAYDQLPESTVLGQVTDVLWVFTSLTSTACHFAIAYDFEPDAPRQSYYRDTMVAWFESQFELLRPTPPQAVAFSKINIGGTFDVLVHDALAFAQDPAHPRQLIPWRMQKQLVDAFMRFARDGPEVELLCRAVVEMRMGEFLALDARPRPAWFFPWNLILPDIFEDERLDAVVAQHAATVPPLEDVEFEAVGPERVARNYGRVLSKVEDEDAVCILCLEDFAKGKEEEEDGDGDGNGDGDTRPLQLECMHVFHCECLNKLINGIAPFSNRCPACRREICAPRPRRAVESEDSNLSEVSRMVDAAVAAEALEDALDRNDDWDPNEGWTVIR